MSDDAILFSVAIDFGTAYSGYAYLSKEDFETNPRAVHANVDWQAGNVGFSRKTPTVLLLNPCKKFKAFGFEAEKEYSQLAVHENHADWYYFRHFKMELHGEKVVRNDMTLVDETGKELEAMIVFAESIKYLKDHFLEKLNEEGQHVHDSEIQYILTVPAIWNDSAKQFMRNAAEKAGIDGRRLKIALEPEAAALFCQYERTKLNHKTFAAAETGTKYMVIDLGGGTVDIALHKKLENERIQELYQASGGPFGGTVVDDAFIQLLTGVFGEPLMDQFRKEYTCDFLDLMREFEIAKRNLNPSSRLTFNTRIPSSFGICCKKQNDKTLIDVLSADNFPFRGKIKVIGDKLLINENIMLEIFSSVTTKITDIVHEVLSQPVADGCHILLLVGGFAESKCVQKAIKDRFETEGRRVIVPAESGLTVVKGAAIFGYKKDFGIVTERVIRYTYGIATKIEFDNQKHNPDYKFWLNGKEFVQQFSPFMNKGTSVKEGTIVTEEYYYDEFLAGSGITVYSTLNDVQFIEEGGLEQLVNITVDKSDEKFYGKRVDIEVSYTFGDTELHIFVECIQTGKSFRAKVGNYS